MTSLFDVSLLLAGGPQALLIRVVDHGADPVLVGAVRLYLPGAVPVGDLAEASRQGMLDSHARREQQDQGRAHLLQLRNPTGPDRTFLVQWSTDIPDVAWELLRARCPVVLRTQMSGGDLITSAAVPMPAELGGEPLWAHSAAEVGRVFTERLTPPPRLSLLGVGPLVKALAGAARLMRSEPEHLTQFAPGDLQHLTPADVLLIVLDDPQIRGRATGAALASRAGFVGVVCRRNELPDASFTGRDRLRFLDAGHPMAWPPNDAAASVLAAVMADQPRPTPTEEHVLVLTPHL